MKIVEVRHSNRRSLEKIIRAGASVAEVEIDFQIIESADFESEFENLKTDEELKLMVATPGHSVDLVEMAPSQTTVVFGSEEFDSFLHYSDRWWPQHFFAETLKRFITKNIEHLDRKSDALIAGLDTFPAACAWALSQVGFQRVLIAANEEEDAPSLVTRLKRNFFGVQWTPCTADELTEQAGTFSFLLTSLDEERDDVVLNNLYYFNFLKPGGIVLDTRLMQGTPPLIKEALEINAQTYTGIEFYSLWASLVFEKLTGKEIDSDAVVAEYLRQQ